MKTNTLFNILVADSSGKILQIPENELMRRNIDVARLTNRKDFDNRINNKGFNLIFVCMDNDEFLDEEVVSTIRSSEKNHETPIIVALTSHPEDEAIENLLQAGTNDIIFDCSNDKHFLSKIRLFQQFSAKLASLNQENNELRKENIELRAGNDRLNLILKDEKNTLQKAYKELAKEIGENVNSKTNPNEKSRLLLKRVKETDRRLKISKENYEHITANVPSGIVIVKKDGRFFYYN